MAQTMLTVVIVAFLFVTNACSERFGFGGGLRIGQKGMKNGGGGSGMGDSIFDENDKNSAEDASKVATETKVKAFGEVSKTSTAQEAEGGVEAPQNPQQNVEEQQKEIEGEVGVSVQKNGPPKRGGKFQFPCGTF